MCDHTSIYVCKSPNKASNHKIRESHNLKQAMNFVLLETLLQALEVNTTISNKQVVQQDDIVFLAVKPNAAGTVLHEISSELTNKKLLVSIAAGINIRSMEQVTK